MLRDGRWTTSCVHEVNPAGKIVATTYGYKNGLVDVVVERPKEWFWPRNGRVLPLGQGENEVPFINARGEAGQLLGNSESALGRFFAEQSFVPTDREGCGGSGTVFDSQGRGVSYQTDGYGQTIARFPDGAVKTYDIHGEIGIPNPPHKKFLGIF